MTQEILSLLRDIGRERGDNALYRECYVLYKALQDYSLSASEQLMRLYHQEQQLASEDSAANLARELHTL